MKKSMIAIALKSVIQIQVTLPNSSAKKATFLRPTTGAGSITAKRVKSAREDTFGPLFGLAHF
jgi:hypothetical protein